MVIGHRRAHTRVPRRRHHFEQGNALTPRLGRKTRSQTVRAVLARQAGLGSARGLFSAYGLSQERLAHESAATNASKEGAFMRLCRSNPGLKCLSGPPHQGLVRIGTVLAGSFRF